MEKTLKFVITFRSATEAIRMERSCKEAGMPGRLIPVPRQISASCGLSWMTELSEKDRVLSFMQSAGLGSEGCFEVPFR